MNYLILSRAGLSLFTVPRLAKSAHAKKIYYCNLDPAQKTDGKSLWNMEGWEKLVIVTDPYEVINQTPTNDLVIIVDDVGIGAQADNLRKQGYKVVGGSEFMDKLENERQFATEFMQKYMKVPESTVFDSFSAGISWLKQQPREERFVFKPNDTDVPKEYTYVSKDVADMIQAMEEFKSKWEWEENFQLQRFIKGVEVDFNAYFNGTDYLPGSFILYFENKPLMNDDIGPATGGSIAVEFPYKMDGKLYSILDNLAGKMKEVGYRGQIAINSIISEEDHEPYFLEFTSRFGYPSLPMEVTLVEDNNKNFADLIDAMANGTTPKLFPENVIAGVVSVEAGMSSGEGATKGVEMSWSSQYDRYFFPYGVMYGKGRKYELTGKQGNHAVDVTCSTDNLSGVVEMIYDNYMPTLKLKDKMYRTDLGKSAKDRMKKLHEWGLI